MGLENWLTDKAIKSVFDKLEKGVIRISGLDSERELVIWVSQSRKSSEKPSKKG